MAENFTVYSFQLRADDYTKFVGAGDTEYDDVETNSEEDFGSYFGGVEKQDMTSMAADQAETDELFDIVDDEPVIFDIGDEGEVELMDEVFVISE
jgi:hypothetical protein